MSRDRYIGWIGLGKMGLPMATRLVNAGLQLRVYNRTAERTASLAGRSAVIAGSPHEIAQDCHFIFTMVSDDQALEEVAMAPSGVVQNARNGSILIDMSTVSPEVSARLGALADGRGIRYLRAPVSGSTKFAEAGTLTIFASGSKDAYEECLDILSILGQKIYYAGAHDQARYLKLAINLMIGTTALMTAEALTLGTRGGLDWEQMIEIISNSAVASPLIGYKSEQLKNRDFKPTFTAAQMAKDLQLALHAGQASECLMPLTALVRQFLGIMKAKGRGDMDFFALVSLWGELSGLEK
jgi:3-hydroxyisobutyrate dehydrogenase-like beta-hydroxyacid dehydrogenase